VLSVPVQGSLAAILARMRRSSAVPIPSWRVFGASSEIIASAALVAGGSEQGVQ
jgi:hypothetical protein